MNIPSNLDLIAAWADAHPYIVSAVMLWALAWKGFALWNAAQRDQKYWFIGLLFVNTLGILDIIYIYFVAKGSKVEVVEN